MTRFCHAVISIFLAVVAATGQDQNTNNYAFVPGNGTVSDHVYKNYIVNFSYPFPDGWNPSREQAKKELENLSKFLPNGYLLFMADQHSTTSVTNQVIIVADPTEGDPTSHRLDDYTAKLALQLAKKEGVKLVRDAIAMDLAGRRFMRADFDANVVDGTPYHAVVCTELNGYFLGWIFATVSDEERNAAVNSLRQASFGNLTLTNPPARLRVSSLPAHSQMLKSVPPVYPLYAKAAHISGDVVLNAVISRTGDIQELKLASGHPILVEAAMESVKRWKFKPPIFQGAPVEVETQIIVHFRLFGY